MDCSFPITKGWTLIPEPLSWLLNWADFKLGQYPGGSDHKESACNARDPGLIPGLERLPGEGNGNPLQYSCLEKSMDRGAWQVQSMMSQSITKSQTQLSD